MNRRDFFGFLGALGGLPFVNRLAKPVIQVAPNPWHNVNLGPVTGGGVISATSGKVTFDKDGFGVLRTSELDVGDFIHYIDVRPTATLDNPPDSPYEQLVEAEVDHYWLDVEGW